MNYQKIYVQLCYKYKVLNLNKDPLQPGAFETHHIIPRACNGINDISNLVVLPIKAHFIAHHLLKKIYKGTKYEIAMNNAFNLMCNTKTDYYSKKQYGVKVTLQVYLNAKHDMAKHIMGDNNPSKRKDVREKLSLKAKGRKSWCKGLKKGPITNEQKQKMSMQLKNRIWINDGIKDYFVKPDDPRILTYWRGRLNGFTKESNIKKSLACKGKPNYKNRGKIRSKETREKLKNKMKQLIWVTNGNKILRVLPDKIPNGFYKGRKFKPKKLKKTTQYTIVYIK